MGNCPYDSSFPIIKCCRYSPKIVLSYRHDNYEQNKDKMRSNFENYENENNNDNIIDNRIDNLDPMNDEQFNKRETKNVFKKNDSQDEEEDKQISASSRKIRKNTSKIKYSKLTTFKRQLTTEEFIKMKLNKDLLINLNKNDNLKSSTKNNFIMNQQTVGSNFKHFITKKTTSTTNTCQKLVFNLPVIQEDETNSNKEVITNILKKNIFFRINFNENQLEQLVSYMTVYQVGPNNNIFSKDDFGQSLFILEKGELYLYNNNFINNNNIFSGNNILINGDYCFGELCLLNEEENVKRTYSANSISDLKFYILNKEQYHKFMISEKINIECMDENIIKNIELLRYITSEELFYLRKLSYILDEFDNEKNSKLEQEQKMIYLNFIEFLNLNINLTKQDPRVLFLKLEIPNYSHKFLIISIHSIIEIFGMNFKFKIIFRLFNHKIKKDLFLLNDIEGNYNEIVSLYSVFKYKHLEKESSLGIKFLSDNNFIILILEGTMELYDDKNRITKYKSFDLINTNIIQNKTKLIFSLNSIILHAKYEDVVEKINNIKEIFSSVIKKMYICNFLCELNDDEFLFFLNKMKKQKYKKDDIIISDEVECNKFYLIIEGEVKHKSYEDETIQKYSENDCFGETFLLDDISKNLKDTYIYVTSDNLITVELDKENFFFLLKNPKINDYIKLKMCLEDKSINFCDLYFLYHLYETRCGNLYLVHNGIFLYVIKSISRLIVQGYDNEKQYIINKLNILKTVNHKFIVKMVTKFKNDNWYFYLMEYVNGIKLNEAIKFFPKIEENSNLLIDYVKFYSGIIFIIIDYLHSHKIIHRDLKINNFMIENDGYLKLMDIGSAKKILNGYAKTLLGTPHYIAPEIVEGLNYSYSADYYSIGICLFYLLYNKFPFGNNEKDVYKIYQDILKTKYIFKDIEVDNNSCHDINELIYNLLLKNPNKRYSNINIIKSNKFFKGFNWDLLFAKKIKPPFIPKIDNKFNKENLLNNYKTTFESYIENVETMSEERDTSHVKIENDISEGFGSGIFQKLDILNEEF